MRKKAKTEKGGEGSAIESELAALRKRGEERIGGGGGNPAWICGNRRLPTNSDTLARMWMRG